MHSSITGMRMANELCSSGKQYSALYIGHSAIAASEGTASVRTSTTLKPSRNEHELR